MAPQESASWSSHCWSQLAAWLGTGSSLDLWLFGAAALALAGVAAVSDAGWVVAIDLCAAILLGTLAVGGATLLAPIAPARALRSVPEITPRPNAAVVPVARGIGLVGIVTVPFAALLISADAAFAAIADGIPFPATDLWPARGVVFVVVLAGALGLGLVRREQYRQLSLERSRALRPDRVDASPRRRSWRCSSRSSACRSPFSSAGATTFCGPPG